MVHCVDKKDRDYWTTSVETVVVPSLSLLAAAA